MWILDSPTYLLYIGIVCVVLYSLGQYGRMRYGEYLRIIGFAGVALVLLKLFFSLCPGRLFGYLLPLLAIALVCPVIIWIFHKIRGTRKRPEKFSFDRHKVCRDDHPVDNHPENTEAIHSRETSV